MTTRAKELQEEIGRLMLLGVDAEDAIGPTRVLVDVLEVLERIEQNLEVLNEQFNWLNYFQSRNLTTEQSE